MAALEPLKRGGHPSVSETSSASTVETLETLDQAGGFHAFHHHQTQQTVVPSPRTSVRSVPTTASQSASGAAQQPSLPGARNGRSQSLAIRRKPLSSTASPLATRYSSRDYLEIGQPSAKPEQRFSRSYSVDSPTLYEFPDKDRLPISSLNALASLSSPLSSQQ